MTDARLHIATPIEARVASATLPTAASFAAPAAARRDAVEWPAERRHRLEGPDSANVRNESGTQPDCAFQTADPLVRQDRRDVMSVRCLDDASRARTRPGRRWIDEIAGRCLILVGPDASPTHDDVLYRVRLRGAARTLHQDGGRCQSPDGRDDGMVLIRRDARTVR